ncbi:MAG: DHH family phosphoesterase [Flavobacteriales bacterium]|nr:DHH family phosphoesterase [Flavobacteriales bacterium]|tara:strand:- start:5625 stop:6644 length:1020 start_codon:yes stop_codon:yes gene_type:complete
MQENVIKLKDLLSTPKRIVITTHKGPDGDAIGSSLAMLHFLNKLGHDTTVITPNAYADFLHWMPANKDVLIYEENEKKAQETTSSADLIFLLDFSNIMRISDFANTVNQANAIKILIDHHQNPDMSIADIIFSDTQACSTSQLVYEIISAMNFNNHIDKNIAECLYVGIMTDTGSFKYSSTSAKTHEIIANLIKRGADNAKIHDLIYDNSSANRIKLLGYCLNNKLLLYPENNSAIISLTAEELEKFKFQNGDTEGFVNYPLAIKGIRFATFITEKEGIVKLSLRSKGNFKVNEIADTYFNGGGHMNASGGISQLSINETIKTVEMIINKFKKELTNTN